MSKYQEQETITRLAVDLLFKNDPELEGGADFTVYTTCVECGNEDSFDHDGYGYATDNNGYWNTKMAVGQADICGHNECKCTDAYTSKVEYKNKEIVEVNY